jgi:hypothetical protein
MKRSSTGRPARFRTVTGAVLALLLSLGTSMAVVGTAQAGPYRADCHAWAHSTGSFTSGVSAVCNGGPVSVQYRVVGLCKNRFTQSSRWVYGWWMTTGVSHYGCSGSEVALSNPYYQTQ